jgi:hypothetical protein
LIRLPKVFIILGGLLFLTLYLSKNFINSNPKVRLLLFFLVPSETGCKSNTCFLQNQAMLNKRCKKILKIWINTRFIEQNPPFMGSTTSQGRYNIVFKLRNKINLSLNLNRGTLIPTSFQMVVTRFKNTNNQNSLPIHHIQINTR